MIVISGGAVPVKLDAVKTITNRFKGGRMAELADQLAEMTYSSNIIYLCAKDSVQPKLAKIVHFDGFHDYRAKVASYSEGAEAVVLGAAVANLIPDVRWQELKLKGGKFPSHNYEVGDPVQILFRIAPRVINDVKEKSPFTKLVGFKLLSGVTQDELIDAARLTQRESKASLVIANDAQDLDLKYGVTLEGGWYLIEDLAADINALANDRYYKTVYVDDFDLSEEEDDDQRMAKGRFYNLVSKYGDQLNLGEQENGMIFGCVSVRIGNGPSFLISERGKRNIGDFVTVSDVGNEMVLIQKGLAKASLNAPLIANIFKEMPEVSAVVHYHDRPDGDFLTLPYAPPGTRRDSDRNLVEARKLGRFYIKGHGAFELLEDGEEDG